MFLADHTRPNMVHNVLRMHAVATVHERERERERQTERHKRTKKLLLSSRLPLPLNFGTICVPSSSFSLFRFLCMN